MISGENNGENTKCRAIIIRTSPTTLSMLIGWYWKTNMKLGTPSLGVNKTRPKKKPTDSRRLGISAPAEL